MSITVLALTAVVLAPVAEEPMFRGVPRPRPAHRRRLGTALTLARSGDSAPDRLQAGSRRADAGKDE
jgi:hypothetical protein